MKFLWLLRGECYGFTLTSGVVHLSYLELRNAFILFPERSDSEVEGLK